MATTLPGDRGGPVPTLDDVAACLSVSVLQACSLVRSGELPGREARHPDRGRQLAKDFNAAVDPRQRRTVDAELQLHGTDGQIRQKDSFGNDPR